jgi:hypothetical protein
LNPEKRGIMIKKSNFNEELKFADLPVSSSSQSKNLEEKSTANTKKPSPSSTQTLSSGPKKTVITRIIIKYDSGFNNTLFLRGKGANLSWEKGIPLKNFKSDEWVWETETSFTTCEFKVLINDNLYEIGENHLIACGTSLQYTPKF